MTHVVHLWPKWAIHGSYMSQTWPKWLTRGSHVTQVTHTWLIRDPSGPCMAHTWLIHGSYMTQVAHAWLLHDPSGSYVQEFANNYNVLPIKERHVVLLIHLWLPLKLWNVCSHVHYCSYKQSLRSLSVYLSSVRQLDMSPSNHKA